VSSPFPIQYPHVQKVDIKGKHVDVLLHTFALGRQENYSRIATLLSGSGRPDEINTLFIGTYSVRFSMPIHCRFGAESKVLMEEGMHQ
jgi:hypothetical protein